MSADAAAGGERPRGHAVEPEPDGSATPADRLRLRLYGVTATAALAAEVVAPYTLQATGDGRDTILVVTAAWARAGHAADGGHGGPGPANS